MSNSRVAVTRVMTPRFLKRHRVRQMARHQFVASGAKLSHAQPHILIYASLADRRVELVAHDAIHKAVGEGPWNAAVAAVTEEAAIITTAVETITVVAVTTAAVVTVRAVQERDNN